MRFFLILAFSTAAMAGEYTTYIGDTYPRTVAAIAADAAGNTYVVGNRGNPLTAAIFSALIFDPIYGFLLGRRNRLLRTTSLSASSIQPAKFCSRLPSPEKAWIRALPSQSIQPAISTSPEPLPRPIFRSATRCNRRTVRTGRGSSSNSARMESRFSTPPISAGSPAPPASTP